MVDAVPVRKQCKQNWPLYNAAQQTERDRFRELLFDLLRGIEEPPQPKTGRRRVPLQAMLYSSALKVFTTLSSRRFACELKDAHERGLLLDATVANGFKLGDVCADKAYLSHDNLAAVVAHGGTPYIPFKVTSQPGEPGTLWERMFGYFQFRRPEFLSHYHQRSNVESTFSMVKAKFRDDVRSRTDTAMKNEVLLKFLCHNIVVVHQAIIELGIEAEFWPGSDVANTPRAVIRFPGA